MWDYGAIKKKRGCIVIKILDDTDNSMLLLITDKWPTFEFYTILTKCMLFSETSRRISSSIRGFGSTAALFQGRTLKNQLVDDSQSVSYFVWHMQTFSQRSVGVTTEATCWLTARLRLQRQLPIYVELPHLKKYPALCYLDKNKITRSFSWLTISEHRKHHIYQNWTTNGFALAITGYSSSSGIWGSDKHLL